MRYRPEIDGLRAVAVIPVILFHAGFSAFAGGYIGVDVFFVISGYLITTILIGEREAGTYSLLGFYERRARRILPALFLVLLCTIPFAWRWLAPDPFEDYARSQAFAALFLSNFHFLEKSSYYDVGSALRPLLHTWSLAVEEQFYLLFPLVLLPLGLFVRQKFLIVFLILSALSLALAEWGWRTYPGENFYFTFSRLWELLAGSICAAILFNRPQMRSDTMGLAGLALIIYSIFFYNEAVPFPSVYALVPVVGSMLIILFADRGTWTARVLSASPMVWIGLVSYSAYLWHQPLFAFARIRSIGEPSLWVMSGLTLMTLALAWLTMRYVETPFRRRTVLPGQRGLLTVSAAGIAAIAAFGFVGDGTGGFPSRIKEQAPGMLTELRNQLIAPDSRSGCVDGDGIGKAQLCTIYTGDGGAGTVAVLGDSHGQAMIPGFAALSRAHGVDVLMAARGACPPLLGVYLAKGGQYERDCHDFVQKTAQEVVDRGVGTVYLVARWSLYATGEYADEKATYALSPDFGARHVRQAERLANFEVALDETLAFYEKAGVRVVLVGQVPLQWVIAQTLIEQAMLMGLDTRQSRDKFRNSFVTRTANDGLVQDADRVLHQVAERRGAEVLMLADRFADGDSYVWIRDGEVLYRDTNHLSVVGARGLAPVFAHSYAPG
ncbi:acyltransferase family protein [Roseovarius sp. Pro17]|uniref:acyltransferase family protein n=1 Tax=Roseovarius sp. Pro17 TaxID=3108175 RepID=UPI002D793949|nr:acyltransferase family protein [Roseovarius sp. Pro17]